ncbi:MAG: hybrid sensor histidine kinase/response regulator [Pseudobdellovibrionaceae bacterium]
MKRPFFLSLDKKLIAVILVVNVIFTFFWTALNIYFEDQSGREELKKDFEYIESVVLPALQKSIWGMDHTQVRDQIKGMLTNPYVTRVRITETGNPKPLIDLKKEGDFQHLEERKYKLFSSPGPNVERFGTLSLFITMDPLLTRLKNEVLKGFISETLETLILSLLLLYAFRLLVLNDISRISRYFKRNSVFSKTTPHFHRKIPGRFKDEIDNLITAINRTVDESKFYQIQIEHLRSNAEKANQAKSMFLASINHELRTPLNAILGVADLLPNSLNEPSEIQDLLTIQKRSGLHLLHLVDEILDFSKIEAGQMKIESTVMDIRNCLETTRSILETPIQDKGNQLSINIDPNFPSRIRGDGNRLNQIVINLVSNANKFTQKGKIRVEVKALNSKYRISVIDNGIGIPSDQISEIFIPFRQLAGKNGEIRKGTGIGLSITKKLVELMNGTIKVISNVGVGSEFQIDLPLEVAHEEAKPLQPSLPKTPSILDRKLKLLVVEDTPEVQMLIRAFLKGTNVQLSFAENGQEGLRNFQKENFNLVLLDLQMPVMDGFEAAQKMREFEVKVNHNSHHVPILALTALTTKSDIDHALEAGCDGYVTKPFSRSQLLNTLRDYAAS